MVRSVDLSSVLYRGGLFLYRLDFFSISRGLLRESGWQPR